MYVSPDRHGGRAARLKPALVKGQRSKPLALEVLEQRLVLYAFGGSAWANLDVSFSFLPDGTLTEGYTSNLFAELNAIAPTATWQREFARAVQTWANVSNLNFHMVADDGSPTGTSGLSQ